MDPINRREIMSQIDERWARVLVDYDVDLPTTQLIIGELIPHIEKGESYAVLFLTIDSIIDMEKIYGFDKYDSILIRVAKRIKEISGDVIRNEDIITIERVKSRNFIIFLSSPRRGERRFYQENLDKITSRVQESTVELLSTIKEIPSNFIKVNTGYSIIVTNPLIRVERSIYRAINDAVRMARHRSERQRMVFREELKQIIMSGEVRTVFQPIVKIPDLVIHGYEALSRGPISSKLETPDALFSIAEDFDLVEDLDDICKVKSLINFQNNASKREGGASDIKLFLNTEPKAFLDPVFNVERLKKQIGKHGLTSTNLVLEITERSAISNYKEFSSRLDEFRKEGFQVAIDDAGSGYSSLQAIAELRPDYVKIDMALVRNIDTDSIKQDLISALVKFSESSKTPIIAEGVETALEFEKLVEMGVQYAQGFYFARPEPDFIKNDKIIII